MRLPVLGAIKAITAGKAVYDMFKGRGGGRRGGAPYRRPDFRFDFNENDPELAQFRRDAIFRGDRTRRNTVGDLARYGLGGSSVGMEVLNSRDLDVDRDLEGIYGHIYGARRGEAREDYSGDVAHARRLELGDIDYRRQIETEGRGLRNQALGGLGGVFGKEFQDWLKRRRERPGAGDEDYEDFIEMIQSSGWL